MVSEQLLSESAARLSDEQHAYRLRFERAARRSGVDPAMPIEPD